MMRCVRCGAKVTKERALRCDECRKLVDQELKGEANRPYTFYFKRYRKWRKLSK